MIAPVTASHGARALLRCGLFIIATRTAQEWRAVPRPGLPSVLFPIDPARLETSSTCVHLPQRDQDKLSIPFGTGSPTRARTNFFPRASPTRYTHMARAVFGALRRRTAHQRSTFARRLPEVSRSFFLFSSSDFDLPKLFDVGTVPRAADS